MTGGFNIPLTKVSELKPYELNEKLFDSLPQDQYSALKKDIEKRGILTELHILPNKTVICGHQRLKIAKELGMQTIPCKEVSNLNTPEEIEEYVIKDNLLRRQLEKKQKYFLINELSKLYETPRVGMEYKQNSDASVAYEIKEDVLQKTSKEAGVSPRTVANARKDVRLREENPELKHLQPTKIVIEVKKKNQLKEIKSGKLKVPEGKFNLIVIDPPWETLGFDSGNFRGGAKYPTMTVDEIKQIKLPSDENCVLWFWTIDQFLPQALEIIKEWGFERKSTLIWNKEKMGLGNWLRNQHEYCFLAIKGKPVFHGENFRSVLNSLRTKHSEKPDAFYKLIENASPYQKKLDYFARKKRNKWNCYGDEINE